MIAKYYLFKSQKMHSIKQFFVYVCLPVNENSDYLGMPSKKINYVDRETVPKVGRGGSDIPL